MKCLKCGKEQSQKFCTLCTEKAYEGHKKEISKRRHFEMLAKYDYDPYEDGCTENDLWR